jgi:hypothetical protein
MALELTYGASSLDNIVRSAKKWAIEGVMREIERKEGIAFLSPPDRVRIAIALYKGELKALQCFHVENHKSLRDRMVKVLRDYIVTFKPSVSSNKDDLKSVALREVFKTLLYLKDFMPLSLWCRRRRLTNILELSEVEKKAKKYGKRGQTDVYNYLKRLEYIVSSFNLATSFGYDVWWSQLYEGKKPNQEKFIRITVPGALFLDIYADYVMEKFGESELESKLEEIVLLPKFTLDVLREKISAVGELPLFPLTKEIAKYLEVQTRLEVTPYTQLLANDIVNLLLLYERERLDGRMLTNKMVVRWKLEY